jgi:Spy/CpxP family protein refolding chaperone
MKSKRKILIATAVVVALGALGAGVAIAARGAHFGRFAERIYNKVKADLALSAEQGKKVDGLKDRIFAQFRARKGDRKALVAEAKSIWLADRIDDARVDGLVKKIDELRVRRQQVVRDAVKELHGILTPQQRQKLVDVIEKFRAKMRAKWGKHARPDSK